MNAFVRGEAHPIHDLVALRWSPKQFSAETVDPELLWSLLEAARWAPSSFNEQPWRFMVARREEEVGFDKLAACLSEKNQAWARDAAVLMLAVAKTTFTRSGKPNRHAFYDVGQAVAQLTLQATASGLGVHQMAGFDGDKARETFSIPEDYEPVVALALGYSGSAAERGLRKRARKPQSELAFAGTFGDTLTY